MVADEHAGDLLAGREEGEVEVLGDRDQALVLVRVETVGLLWGEVRNGLKDCNRSSV